MTLTSGGRLANLRIDMSRQQHVIQTAREIVALASDSHSSFDALKQARQSFFAKYEEAPRKTATQALEMLVAGLQARDLERAGFVAMVCGGLIERGVDPQPLIRPLLERIRPLIAAARVFHDASATTISADAEEPDRQFAEATGRLAKRMPDEAKAWSALYQFFPPLIAVLSVSREARRDCQTLADAAAAISRFHEAGHWIAHILKVLDDEMCLVIEPRTNLGIAGRLSGISGNFQLNVLLMDVFPQPRQFGLFRKRRVSRSAAGVARGNGPQQTDETLTATWNLYAWTAVGSNRELPDHNDYSVDRHWIWNEGVPCDIPVFDGYRVILLGPPSYARFWNSQRDFYALKADLTVERELTGNEILQWLDRFATAGKS